MNRRWVAVTVFLTACGTGPGASDRVQRTDSAGVEIVVSAGADRILPWRLEPVWRAGGADDERLAVPALAAHEVSGGPDGRVFVLDGAGRRVLVFSPGGELVDTLGREGGGPGELESPMALSVAGDGVVAVYDFARGGLVRWSAEGEVLDVVRMDDLFWGPGMEVTDHGVVFATFEGRTESATRLGLLSWSPDSARTLARFTSAPLRPADFPSCGQQGTLVAPLFSPELLWSAAGRQVAVTTDAAYVIDVHQGGDRARSVRRDVPPRPVTQEMALRHVGDGVHFGAVECTIPPAEAVRGYGYGEVLPSLEAVSLSPEGEVWALRGRVADEPGRTDVFGSDGAYLGTLPPGSPFPAAFLPDGGIVAVEMDYLDVPVVAVYRVIRP